MKIKNYLLIIIILLMIFGAAVYTYRTGLIDFSSNKKITNHNEYYKSKDNEVALLYNNDLQTAKAIKEDDSFYLPLNWVSSILNDRFYFSDKDKVLIYTLANEILYSDFSTLGNNNKKLLIENNDEVYISVNVVANYTDIIYDTFEDEKTKRIFITNKFDSFYKANIRTRTKLRVKKGKEAEVVKVLKKNESITIISEEDIDLSSKESKNKWIKVASSDGHVGYLKAKYIKNLKKSKIKTNFKKEEYPNISLGKKVLLAWHQTTSLRANNQLELLLDNAKHINVISPTWFSLSDNNGNYTSLASKEYVDKAHKRGVQVWALIDNFNKDISSFKILSSMAARKNLINNLISDAKKLGLDGINIDFEQLKKDTSRHYIQFIRELSVAMRNNSLILSIDNPNYASFNAYYKRDKQAEVADYIINMAYDEHYFGSEKGSVASINFVKQGIDNTLKEVPASKLINAIPLYTRLWTDNSSKALGIKAAKEWVAENNVDLVWNDELLQYYGQANIKSENYYIWLEEEKSIEKKLSYMKEKDLAGFAAWKLGLEPNSIWEVLKTYKD